MIRNLLFAAAASCLLSSAAHAATITALIGTYTPPPGPSTRPSDNHGEGIYAVSIDTVTGATSNPKLVAKTLSPSWMALSPDGKFLYAVNEISDYGPDKTGSVTAFAVGAGGSLKELNTVSSGGAGPAYIAMHPSGKFVLIANYGGGDYAVIRIKGDGSLGEQTDVVKPSGPLNPPTATDNPPGNLAGSDHRGSRGHMIGPDPTGQYVIGDDAGRDQVFVWKLDMTSGKLNEVSVAKSLPGSAPRHFVFAPDGKTMYQFQEQDSRLAVYGFAGGKLTQKGATISTLPPGYEGSNTGSELLIDKAGKHLYAANRTQDSIATFAIGADGMATKISNVPTEADNPRSLALSPDGKFLYSLNQRGDNVTTYRIGANGAPKFTGHYMALGTPAVMVFVK